MYPPEKFEIILLDKCIFTINLQRQLFETQTTYVYKTFIFVMQDLIIG